MPPTALLACRVASPKPDLDDVGVEPVDSPGDLGTHSARINETVAAHCMCGELATRMVLNRATCGSLDPWELATGAERHTQAGDETMTLGRG
jgi:hypothetical protein